MQSLAQRIMLMAGWQRAGLALVLGAIGALAQAPFHLFVVLFISLPALVWLLDGAVGTTPARRWSALRPAFAIGWWFGLGYFTAGLWWIANALLVEAPEFAWAIPLAVLGLPAVLAVFYGLACALARAVWSDSITRIFALAAGFGLLEWLRGVVLTGFPWNALGYALMPVPVMMQPAAIVGVFGMSALAVLVFALPAQFAIGRRAGLIGVALSALLLGAHVGYGAWRLAGAPDAIADDRPLVRLVQPAIAQERKIDQEARQAVFRTLLDLTALDAETGETPQIVIWPETAVPFILTREAAALAAIGDTLADEQTLLTGAAREEPAEDDTSRFYNSVLAITGDGVISAASDKVHLVPFGEYLPFGALLDRVGLRGIAEAADRGYSAAPARTLIAAGGITALPLICYEAIFPRFATPPGGETIDAIVNVTNDGWFGHTPGPWQHMHQARLRAVETGLPMLRIANNGISGAVDPYGRFVARIGHDARAVADVRLPPAIQPWFNSRQQKYNFWWLIGALFGIAVLGWALRSSLYRISPRND